MTCDDLENALHAVLQEVEFVHEPLLQFEISKVRECLGKYWEPDQVTEIIRAVEKFRIWSNNDSGMVAANKLIVSWRAAIRDCKDKQIGLE
jgi:hypothetical protein